PYGDYAGQIVLTTDKPVCELNSVNQYVLPKQSLDVWLELDYKCTQPFSIGIRSIKGSSITDYYKLTLNSQKGWNKVYVQFSDEVSNLNGDTYQILIKAIKDTTVTDGIIWLDNVKLLHETL